MHFYNSENVEEVMAAFQAAYENTLARFLSEAEKQKVIAFVSDISAKMMPYEVLTPDGTQLLIQRVFTDKHYSEFIRVLQFQFFSRWACSEEELKGLCSSMAIGCSAEPRDSNTLSFMPEVYRNRMLAQGDATSLLRSNLWLLMVLLIIAFSTVGDK